MKQIRSTSDAVKQFIRLLESGGHSYSVREKFHDFLELAYCAHAKLTAPTRERGDELEARYMKTVERYREDDLNLIRETYPKMLGIAVAALQWGGIDFLGYVAGELSALSAEQGQFFTPYEVSKMMARMTFGDDARTEIERDGYLTFVEPAAGAGGMVLAFADVLEDSGFKPSLHMLVQTVDVSNIAYQMCFLQLTWRGVAAYVNRGNSLSMAIFEGAWTPAAMYQFLPHHGHLSFDKTQAREQQQIWRLLRAVQELFEPNSPSAISPVGERHTVSEMTFRYTARTLPVILPIDNVPVIDAALEIVEAAFDAADSYVQLRMF